MVSLQWLEPSVFLSVRVCISGKDRLWYWTHQKFVSEVSPWLVVSECCLMPSAVLLLWQHFVSDVPPLALISQFVCHNCLVPGFTDDAGCCVVTMS
jgi:hypothetical protein